MTVCKHENFQAKVAVGRLPEVEGGPVKRYMAEIQINCADCGKPFQFLGLDPGLNLQGATVSLDGLEANIALVPQGTRPAPIHGIMGYSIGRAP